MRPRRRVLFFCADERELSVTRFILDCRLYAVTACQSVDDIQAVSHQTFDCGIVLHTLRAGENQAGLAMAAWFRDMPILAVVVSNWNLAKMDYPAACMLTAPSTRELLDSIKILACRKRTPPILASAVVA